MNTKEREESLTLGILETIDQQEDVTQRHLADRLGVALGLTNSYLKRCVKKGWIKIHQAPANRYLYYLTPKGFAEKSRLTTAYLSISFNFYREAGVSLTHIYNECERKGYSRILFCGISELAEIASIRSLEHHIKIIGIWDPDSNKNKFLHLPVWQLLEQADEHDGCLITSLNKADQYIESLKKKTSIDKVLVPSILGIDISQTNKISSSSKNEE